MKARKPSTKQNQLLQQALFLHQGGRLAEAEAQYRNLLKVLPDHPQLLTGLGTIALQKGAYLQAEKLLGKSVAAFADQPNAHCNRGVALAKLNRLHEALASYQCAIALKPDYAMAHNNRGLALKELQQFEAALAI